MHIFNSGNCGEPPSTGVKVLSLDLIWTLKAALVAYLAEWTDVFNSGYCREPPSKGVKVLSLDLMWTLKTALVADLAECGLICLIVAIVGISS